MGMDLPDKPKLWYTAADTTMESVQSGVITKAPMVVSHDIEMAWNVVAGHAVMPEDTSCCTRDPKRTFFMVQLQAPGRAA